VSSSSEERATLFSTVLAQAVGSLSLTLTRMLYENLRASIPPPHRTGSAIGTACAQLRAVLCTTGDGTTAQGSLTAPFLQLQRPADVAEEHRVALLEEPGG